MTHYILPFTDVRRGLQRTACNAHVFMSQHSVEPSCPACRAFLENDDAEGARLAASWAVTDAAAAARKAGL